MTLMDTAQLLGNVGEFICAIVIVITLIYLALQIRKNTKAPHGQSRQAVLPAAQAELFSLIEHPELYFSQTRTGLPPEDHIKLGAWLGVVVRTRGMPGCSTEIALSMRSIETCINDLQLVS